MVGQFKVRLEVPAGLVVSLKLKLKIKTLLSCHIDAVVGPGPGPGSVLEWPDMQQPGREEDLLA